MTSSSHLSRASLTRSCALLAPAPPLPPLVSASTELCPASVDTTKASRATLATTGCGMPECVAAVALASSPHSPVSSLIKRARGGWMISPTGAGGPYHAKSPPSSPSRMQPRHLHQQHPLPAPGSDLDSQVCKFLNVKLEGQVTLDRTQSQRKTPQSRGHGVAAGCTAWPPHDLRPFRARRTRCW
jgi:hypothetical protein